MKGTDILIINENNKTQEKKMAEAVVKINIEGVEYLLDDLSEEAKAQVQSLRFVDTEIARLNAQIAVVSTAKIAYQNALKDLLPRQAH